MFPKWGENPDNVHIICFTDLLKRHYKIMKKCLKLELKNISLKRP